MVELSQVIKVRVHPGLGIARVGNAVDDYFVRPDVPGETADPGGFYRDREGRIKPQACRFRIYALDAGDNVLGELPAAYARFGEACLGLLWQERLGWAASFKSS